MREWRMMLGPFLIWAAHFVLVYALASLADIRPASESGLWRTLGLALSLCCIIGLAAVMAWGRSSSRFSPLAKRLGLFGGGIALLAVAWQSLPLLISTAPL